MLTSVLRHAELKLKRTLGLASLPEIRRARRRSMVWKLPRVTSRDSRQQAPSSTTTPLLAQRFIAGVISFWRTKYISTARCKCKKISSPSKIQVWWLVFFLQMTSLSTCLTVSPCLFPPAGPQLENQDHLRHFLAQQTQLPALRMRILGLKLRCKLLLK